MDVSKDSIILEILDESVVVNIRTMESIVLNHNISSFDKKYSRNFHTMIDLDKRNSKTFLD